MIELFHNNLGIQGTLAVVVRSYLPKVECIAPPGEATHINSLDCQPILSTIPVSTNEQVFGSQRQAGVQIALPFYWPAGKSERSPPNFLILASCRLHQKQHIRGSGLSERT